MLFPTLAENPTAFQAERDATLKSISAHFGGAPVTGGADAPAAASARVMPKVEAPASSGAAAPKATKKKKEGC